MVLSTEWSQVELIDLINDGNGLGFILVGGKSTGVVIKALIPGGVAERDGRLQCGDHVLQIGQVNLRGYNSEQVATVLRQTGPQVRIVVARPVEASSITQYRSHAPIIPTKMLSDPEELERQLIQQTPVYPPTLIAEVDQIISPHIEIVNFQDGLSSQQISFELLSPCSLNEAMIDSNYIELPETETYEVELRKNVYGLGITVAGYVCEEEDLSGIFVKSIIEGSAAEMSGKIQINDRIVAVDGKTLAGVTNHQAVEILRNTDIAVRLTLERFLRGRKFEHLQVALTEAKENKQLSLPPSPSITTLTWVPPKSDLDSIATEDCDDCQIETELESCTTVDSNIFGQENGNCNDDDLYLESKESTPAVTPTMEPWDESRWALEYPDCEIVAAEIYKTGSLGFSLEGTVEVEDGIEKRPRHYILSISEDSAIANDGTLRPGDELLQVDDHILCSLMHADVLQILKETSDNVKIICARQQELSPFKQVASKIIDSLDARSSAGHCVLQGLLKAQSESSLYQSAAAAATALADQFRSRSVEQVSGLALWSNEPVFIDIEKTERGFGFSILDYQDPLDSEGTVIVVRGLIPGGSAESTNALFPGDRLISVAEHNLQGRTLDETVAILKTMPLGPVRIGLCRPLSASDNNLMSDNNKSLSPPETPT